METNGPDARAARLDTRLRDRVASQTAEFDEAFDMATANATPEALDRLHEETDELMRAAGRVLIEIERLAG